MKLSSEGVSLETEEPPLSLAEQIRLIDFENWFSLLDNLFIFLITYMRCVQVQ